MRWELASSILEAGIICSSATTFSRDESPVTINMGCEMPSWFDIRSLDKDDGNEDVEGVKKASQLITNLIEEEVCSPNSLILTLSSGDQLANFEYYLV